MNVQPLEGKIDLLVVSNAEAATVRTIDWTAMGKIPNPVVATATPALKSAGTGQIVYSLSPDQVSKEIWIGKNYAYTAPGAYPVANHTFAPSSVVETNGMGAQLGTILGDTVLSVQSFSYSPKQVQIFDFDFLSEPITAGVTYIIELNFPQIAPNQRQDRIFSVGYAVGTPAPSLTVANTVDQFVTQINQNESANKYVVASNVGNVLRITALDYSPEIITGGYLQGFVASTNVITQVQQSKRAIGDYDFIKSLTYRKYGAGQTMTQVYYSGPLPVEANLGCQFDCYQIMHGEIGQKFGTETNFPKESWLVIERNPADLTVPNANADIMLVKTNLRNYFNAFNFGLEADVDSNGVAAVGIWGS